MTHGHYLDIYKKSLSKDGALYIKHDNQQFFEWTLEGKFSAAQRKTLEKLLIEQWNLDDIHADLGRCGIAGSPTKVAVNTQSAGYISTSPSSGARRSASAASCFSWFHSCHFRNCVAE